MNEEFDLVGNAMARLGRGGGGEVSLSEKIIQLMNSYIDKLHDLQRVPAEQLTDQHLSDIRAIQQQLDAHGIDPNALEDHVMQTTGPAPGTTMHAEGGQVNPEPDYGSSLTALKNWLMEHASGSPRFPVGDLPARAGTAIARQFYGTDKDGHIVFGGRAMTSDQGGTPMQLLDSISGIPYRLADLADKLTGKDSPPGTGGPLADTPLLSGSKDAATREDELNQKVDRSVGLPKAHTFLEHMADNAGIITPIPFLPAEGALSHVGGFLGGSNLRNLPRMTGEFDVLNSALESGADAVTPSHPSGQTDPDLLVHNAVPGHADGGQPAQPDPMAAQPSPTEDSLLNDLLQRRIMRGLPYGGGGEVSIATKLAQLLERLRNPEADAVDNYFKTVKTVPGQYGDLGRNMSDNYPASTPQVPPEGHGGGGEVSIAEKLAQLLERLKGPAEAVPERRTGPRALAQPEAQPANITTATGAPPDEEAAMRAHAEEIARRGWAANASPGDLFTQVAGSSPEMQAHAAEILRRNWAADADPNTVTVQAMENANKQADGGEINWDEIHRRLEALRHATISGQPGDMPPPAVTNSGPPLIGGDHDEMARAASLMGVDPRMTSLELQALLNHI